MKKSFHSRSTGSWRKVKISKCVEFDGVLEKTSKNKKILIDTGSFRCDILSFLIFARDISSFFVIFQDFGIFSLISGIFQR